jgi:hypothetical protein
LGCKIGGEGQRQVTSESSEGKHVAEQGPMFATRATSGCKPQATTTVSRSKAIFGTELLGVWRCLLSPGVRWLAT